MLKLSFFLFFIFSCDSTSSTETSTLTINECNESIGYIEGCTLGQEDQNYEFEICSSYNQTPFNTLSSQSGKVILLELAASW